MNRTFNWKISSDNSTLEESFPCRCGETHEGDYAQERWNHHNCFHGPLWPMDEKDAEVEQMMCSQCGEVFDVERKERANAK